MTGPVPAPPVPGPPVPGPPVPGPAAQPLASQASVPPAAGWPAAGSAGQKIAWGARDISVQLHRVLALDRVSLAVPSGQLTAVVGGDGAGKTTLLRCLAGVLTPGTGDVRLPAAARIGYLSASSGIYPDLTVAQNLEFRATAYGLPAAVGRERVAELTRRAGLADASGRLAGQLSGGMRQKLGVIAAMLHQPDLLVLDEPSTGVDPVSRSGLWWLITRAAADGAAVVFATTYLDEAERAADVLVLDRGQPLAAGTAAQIVAAMPGTLRSWPDGTPQLRPEERAWRRGGRWRVWTPAQPGASAQPGADARPGTLLRPDLQDAVTVAALEREASGPADPRTAGGPVAGTGDETVNGHETGNGHGAAGSAAPAAMAGGGRPSVAPLSDQPAGVASLARCSAVTRRFGEFTAVREVTMEIGPGEIVGLLGANGAGKTTLIRMLLGLLGTTAGEVTLFGEPPSRATRRRIGYLPQGLGLYDDLTAAENLQFSAAVFGAARPDLAEPELAAQERAVRELAGARLVGVLPLGLQRRVAFAQALAHEPELLILDEPTSGVDPLARARLWDTIRAASEAGAGVLVTTHYMEEAGECGRLVVMADGRVVAAGTATQIVGGAQVTVVESASWAAAFARLEEAGMPVALAGQSLRVPGADPRAVAAALRAGAGQFRISQAPATLEERFFQLTAAGTGRS